MESTTVLEDPKFMTMAFSRFYTEPDGKEKLIIHDYWKGSWISAPITFPAQNGHDTVQDGLDTVKDFLKSGVAILRSSMDLKELFDFIDDKTTLELHRVIAKPTLVIRAISRDTRSIKGEISLSITATKVNEKLSFELQASPLKPRA